MQIDLTGAVAWDFPLSSKPQQLQTKPIEAQGNKRAMHALCALHRLRVHRLAQRLVQKPRAAECLLWHHAGRFSDESRASMWLLPATFMAVSISICAVLLQLVAVPVQ
jgi:hypothetical protein